MLTTSDVVPYCSVILATADSSAGLVATVLQVKKHLGVALGARWIAYDYDNAPDGGSYVTTFFSQEHAPNWAPQSAVRELNYGYFAIGMVNGYAIIHCSDNDVKDEILGLLDSSAFPISRIPREVLNFAFIENQEIKSIWLRGIHKKTAVKADSKALTGADLRLAFDRSADQSYSYDSLRGSVRLEKRTRTFGVNLSDSYIWLYQLNTWDELLKVFDCLTLILKNARGRRSSSPLETVSHPIADVRIMEGAYDFAIVDPDALSEGSHGQNRTSLLDKLKMEYDYEFLPAVIQDNVARLRIHHLQNGLRSYIGDVHAEPTIQQERLRFNVTYSNQQPRQLGKLRDFARVFLHPTLLQVWYDSGHTIAGGGCYEVRYKNAPFHGMYWADFRGTNILKEKPALPPNGIFLSNIGAAGEDSLFSWVYRALLRGTHDVRLSHLTMSSPSDWLLCDDGSGEVSDFLHATTINNEHHLTLVHVKAANSDQASRLISVSAHDVVINQAVKNIGSLNKANVITTLSQRVGASNNKPAWNFVNGLVGQASAIDFVDHLKTWRAGRTRFHVVVVQPHTLRAAFMRKANSRQHDQLCTMLNGAAHQIAGLGGSFVVVASRI